MSLQISLNKNLNIKKQLKNILTTLYEEINMDYIIRKMNKNDCFSVARIVTTAQNETYRGIVNDEFLDNLYLNEQERANNFYKEFDENINHQYVLEINNEIVGFINVDVSDDAQYNDCGELYALYLINDYKGHGYGRKLFAMAIKELKNMGFTKMIVGCLAANPTNEFYKHMGGKLIKQRVFEKLKLPENVYLFEKI